MMSAGPCNEITPVTLDSTMKAFKKWRANKSSSGSHIIPSELWEQVFALEDNDVSPRVIKSVLGISSSQYRDKQSKRKQAQTKLDKDVPKPQAVFAEAVIANSTVNCASADEPEQSLSDAANETRKQIKQLKTTNNDNHSLKPDTVIVECIHSDGHRLKIHVTSKSMPEIFAAFFQHSANISLSC